MIESPLLLARMPSYQYHFVVLARIPEQYGYLDRDRFFCIRPFLIRDKMDNEFEPYYRVSFLNGEKQPALPSHAMLWSSIAGHALGRCLAHRVRHRSAARAFRLAALGRADHHERTRFARFAQRQFSRAVPAGQRRRRAGNYGRRSGRPINDFSARPIRKLSPVKPWTGVKFEKHRTRPSCRTPASSGRTPRRPRADRRHRLPPLRPRFHHLAGRRRVLQCLFVAPRTAAIHRDDRDFRSRSVSKDARARKRKIGTPRSSPACAISPAMRDP